MARETFGQTFKRMRLAREWTLRDMAKKVGATFAYLSQIEAGEAKPSQDLVARVAQAFGLRNEEREEFIFVARQIPEQIQEIAQNFPNIAPKYFRKALKKATDK